ncbi:hypothetical protein LINGRAPRIM_LOCUS415 [Linum grandiflorum]
MDGAFELVVHHGGNLLFSSRGPEYIGGTAIEVTMELDNLSYASLLKIGTEDLKYQSVERIFFLTPGLSMVDGIHPLHNESDARQLAEDAKLGVVTLFIEATLNDTMVGDNEDTLSEGWRVFASWFGRNEAFTVKGVGQPHNCPRAMINRSATASWIAKNFIGKFRIYPNMEPEQILQEVKAAYDIDVSLKVCSNAKAEAKKMLEGTLIESYKKLRAYILQLKKSDPEGKFVVEVEPVAGQEYVHFQRMYVGFSCLKKGFLNGCRKFFALDGCFLKGEVKGMILSAVAKDGTNQMFPIAWAVVESENRSSWLWFVSLLQEELNLYDGTGWSVISDQQKVNLYVYIAYFG